MPPPSVSPATPGVRDRPDVAREAERLGRPVELAEERPAVDAGDPRARDRRSRPLIRERSMTMPSSQVEWPGRLWPPLRTAIGEVVVAREPQRRGDLVRARGPDDDGRAGGRSCRSRRRELRRTRVAGQDDVAREPVAESLESGRVEVSDGLVDHVQPPARSRRGTSLKVNADPGQPDH